jgi:transcriptional regulator with XRE-family HTH domain
VANDALRQALAHAKMTNGDLARRVGVSEKTVSRWLLNEGRTPHPRHRWAVCQALEADEAVLWPEAFRAALKTGPDREIVAVYPYRSACPPALWRRLITAATSDITFAGYTSYFLWIEQANLSSALRRKAGAGCRVRFLLGDPDSDVTTGRERLEAVPLTVTTRIQVTLAELEPLRHVEGIEARFSDRHIAMSVFMFDSDMIVTTHLANLVGHDSPTFHLRRCQDDGLFDRYALHVRELWAAARPVWGEPRDAPGHSPG